MVGRILMIQGIPIMIGVKIGIFLGEASDPIGVYQFPIHILKNLKLHSLRKQGLIGWEQGGDCDGKQGIRSAPQVRFNRTAGFRICGI